MDKKQDETFFVVQRSKWARGGNTENPMLLDENGMMCCAGFYAKACGLADAEIIAVGDYADLYSPRCDGERPKVGRVSHAAACGPRFFLEGLNLYGVNDDNHIDDAEREAYLKDAFAKLGVTVEFQD